MNKDALKFWWVLAWQGVAFFTNWTPTKIDDTMVAAMRTDEMFEEFWQLLVSKGWVTNNAFQAKKVVKLGSLMTVAQADLAKGTVTVEGCGGKGQEGMA